MVSPWHRGVASWTADARFVQVMHQSGRTEFPDRAVPLGPRSGTRRKASKRPPQSNWRARQARYCGRPLIEIVQDQGSRSTTGPVRSARIAATSGTLGSRVPQPTIVSASLSFHRNGVAVLLHPVGSSRQGRPKPLKPAGLGLRNVLPRGQRRRCNYRNSERNRALLPKGTGQGGRPLGPMPHLGWQAARGSDDRPRAGRGTPAQDWGRWPRQVANLQAGVRRR